MVHCGQLVHFLKLHGRFIFPNIVPNIRKFGTDLVRMSYVKVLITRPDIPEIALNLLRKECEVILWEKPVPIPKSELLSKVQGIDGLYCFLTDEINSDIINAAGSRLKVVSTMSVGVNHLDLKCLKERNIRIGYTPGILTDATAELIVALLLATSRRLIEANRAIYKGEWTSWSPTWMCGSGLAGSTVGIFGLGRIGLRVAEILKSFNVSEIIYTSRTAKPEASKFAGKKVKFLELLERSDFLIVTTALTPEVEGIFDIAAFKKMKKSAIFINGSRGEVVNQTDLAAALKLKEIRAAGLDVVTPEPIALDDELLKMDNCVILPHIGSANDKTREEMAKITAENILAVLRERPEEMPAELTLET